MATTWNHYRARVIFTDVRDGETFPCEWCGTIIEQGGILCIALSEDGDAHICTDCAVRNGLVEEEKKHEEGRHDTNQRV